MEGKGKEKEEEVKGNGIEWDELREKGVWEGELN